MADFQDEQPPNTFEGDPIVANTQAEFQSIVDLILSEMSTVRRPDTISHHYLVSFSVGPIALSDTSQGLISRAWRLRVIGNEIRLSGALESTWEDEVVLFTLNDGIGVRECDVAFTQSADVVVVLEREDGNLWLWWYDPTIPGYTLANMGAGRNPEVVLDDPFDVTNSDIQLFYMSDVADALVYRTQRERYATEHLTPITGVANLYLEDAIRDSRYRLHLIASERNQVSGQYPKGFFNVLSTQLFPYAASDFFGVAFAPLFAEVLEAIKAVYVAENFADIVFAPIGGQLVDFVIRKFLDDSFDVEFAALGGSLDLTLRHELVNDEFTLAFSAQNGLVEIEITIIAVFEDSFGLAFEALSGLLEVA